MKLIRFIRQEAVLSTAALLAVLSAFLVPPDAGYLSYLDLRTLAVLFALMAVMAGLRRQGVFDRLGRALLGRTRGLLALVWLPELQAVRLNTRMRLVKTIKNFFMMVLLVGPGRDRRRQPCRACVGPARRHGVQFQFYSIRSDIR